MCPPSLFQSAENCTHHVVEPAHVSGALRLAFKHKPQSGFVCDKPFSHRNAAYRFYGNDKVAVFNCSLFKQVISAGDDLDLAAHSLRMYA